MATGIVPNFKEDRKGLARQLRREAPRLHTEDGFSSGLCDLVASVLVLDGASRPTMEEILDHPYLRDTDLNYPTSLLGELVTIYRYWALGGGQRLSLFHGGGAKEIEFPISRNNETWRFSKAPEIGRAGQAGSRTIYSLDPAIDIEATQSQEDNFNSLLPPDPADNKTLKAKIAAKKQEGIRRAEARLGSLFHPNHKGSGKLSTNMNPDPNHPHSDLLLRNNDHSESDVSLKDQGKKKPTFKGTPVDTIKANQPIQAKQRDTMAWDFPGIAAAPQDHQSSASEDPAVPQASQSSSQHDEVHATSDRLEVAQHLSSVPSHPVEPSTLEIPAVPEASQSFSQSNDFGAPNDDFEIDEHLSAAPSRPALRHAVTAPVPHVNATMNRMDLDALMNGTHTATRDAPRQSTRMDLDALMNEEAHNSSTNESHFNAFLPHDQQTVGDEGTATFGPGHSYGYSMPEALTGPHLGAAGPYDAAADDEDYGSAYENLSQSSMNASHRGYPFEAAGPYDTAAAEDDGYPYDNLSQSSIYASSSHHGYPNPPSEHNIETAGPYDRAAAEDDGYPYDNLSQSSIYASSSHHGYPDPRTDHDIEAAGPYDTAAAEDDGYPYDNLSQSSMNASSSHHGYPDQRTEHNPDAPGRYDTAADEDDGLPYDSLSQSSMNASNHGYTESLRTPSSQQGARRTQPATNGTTSDYPEPLRTPSSQHGGRSRTQAAMNGTSSDYPEPLRTPSSPQGIGRTQPATSGGSSDYPEPLRTPNNGGHTRATSPPFDPFAFDPNFDPTFDNPDEFVDIPTPQPPSVESMTEGSSPEVVLAEYRRILRDWNFGLAATAHNWQKVLRDMEAQDERKRREDEGSH